MWKASIGTNINNETNDDGDWETDPDFINNVTEQEQRWGSKTIEGSGRTVGAIDMNKLREETARAYELQKLKQKENTMNGKFGYGGKFGIEKDRMDKSAVGHDYIAKVEKHMSQTDYSTGFGGKFGIQTDRVDKSAVSWDHKENLEKHASQKDYSSGFGGKFGVEKDRQDKSAVGWDHIEKLQKHDSQTVEKKYEISTHQMQKPSELKAKFESLAKQNNIIQVEKGKLESVQAKSAVNNVNTNSSKIIATSKNDEEKFLHNEEKENSNLEPIEGKVKQIQINEKPNEETSNKQGESYSHEPLQEFLSNNETNTVQEAVSNNEDIYEQTDGCFSAIALYDYQAAADDEISFDPDDIITNIEKIDEGWWRGTCHGLTGLFPANYVQLKE